MAEAASPIATKEPALPAAQKLVLGDRDPALEETGVVAHYEPTSKKPSAWTYVFAGTGVAAFGTGALLTYWGRKDNQKLGDCTPMCMTNSVDHVKKLYLASDIAYGVGIAAIGASVLALVAGRGDAVTSEYGVAVVPTKSGAVTSVAMRF